MTLFPLSFPPLPPLHRRLLHRRFNVLLFFDWLPLPGHCLADRLPTLLGRVLSTCICCHPPSPRPPSADPRSTPPARAHSPPYASAPPNYFFTGKERNSNLTHQAVGRCGYQRNRQRGRPAGAQKGARLVVRPGRDRPALADGHRASTDIACDRSRCRDDRHRGDRALVVGDRAITARAGSLAIGCERDEFDGDGAGRRSMMWGGGGARGREGGGLHGFWRGRSLALGGRSSCRALAARGLAGAFACLIPQALPFLSRP